MNIEVELTKYMGDYNNRGMKAINMNFLYDKELSIVTNQNGTSNFYKQPNSLNIKITKKHARELIKKLKEALS